MTIFLLFQAIMALLVVNVLVSRYASRRSDANRRMLTNDEVEVRQLDLKILEAQRREHLGQQRIGILKDAMEGAKEQLEKAEKELEEARRAPPDLYFIFDRLEPKPGIIWEVHVARQTDVPMNPRTAAAWKEPRRYLITAKTPREATDRAGQRFFEKAGLQVTHVAPCPLFLSKRSDVNGEAGSEATATPVVRGARVGLPERSGA